jgi:hypothetical protein
LHIDTEIRATRLSHSPISAEKEKEREGRRVPQRVETGEKRREERKSKAQREEGGKYGCGESGTVEAVCAAM